MTVTGLQRDTIQERSWRPETPTYTVAASIVWVTLNGPDHEEIRMYVPADKAPAIGAAYTLSLVSG
jgi:hypothetical protein